MVEALMALIQFNIQKTKALSLSKLQDRLILKNRFNRLKLYRRNTLIQADLKQILSTTLSKQLNKVKSAFAKWATLKADQIRRKNSQQNGSTLFAELIQAHFHKQKADTLAILKEHQRIKTREMRDARRKRSVAKIVDVCRWWELR